jgi:hypothetical protein
MTIMEASLIIVLGLLGFNADVIMTFIRGSYDNLQRLTFTDICIKLVTSLFWLKARVEMKAEYVYVTYPFVRECTDRVCYAFDYTMATLKEYKIEPYGNNWISITTVEENNQPLVLGEKYSYSEKYHYIGAEKHTDISVNDLYNQCKDHACNSAMARCTANVDETLVVMKVFGNYLYAPYFNTKYDLRLEYDLPFSAGQLHFLTIEYTHPDMSSKILIELPKNMYCKTNRILTPLFVKRYLEHSSREHVFGRRNREYVFDNRYKINIMDNCINMFTLRSNQHIYMHNETYKVVTVYPMAAEAETEEKAEEETEEETEEDQSDDDMPELVPITYTANPDVDKNSQDDDVIDQSDETDDDMPELVPITYTANPDLDKNAQDDDGVIDQHDETYDDVPELMPIIYIVNPDLDKNAQDDDETTRENYTFDQETHMDIEM